MNKEQIREYDRARKEKERLKLEEDARVKKAKLIASIDAGGGVYSDEEKELILKINEQVMSVDGTAEGWGGYHFDPIDYIDTSVEIFDLAKEFFSK